MPGYEICELHSSAYQPDAADSDLFTQFDYGISEDEAQNERVVAEEFILKSIEKQLEVFKQLV